MLRLKVLIFPILIAVLSVNKKHSIKNSIPVISYNDSTLFGNKNYKFSLNIFDPNSTIEEKNNSTLTVYKFVQGKKLILLNDSLYCMSASVEFIDFNNDKIKDLCVFHSTGARANPTYYLYLLNNKDHQLTKIKGFENLPNPSLDAIHNIIVSIALSGANYYSFYRIKNNKLINLGHAFEENPKSTLQYKKAIKDILKKYK